MPGQCVYRQHYRSLWGKHCQCNFKACGPPSNGQVQTSSRPPPSTRSCTHSYWARAERGGREQLFLDRGPWRGQAAGELTGPGGTRCTSLPNTCKYAKQDEGSSSRGTNWSWRDVMYMSANTCRQTPANTGKQVECSIPARHMGLARMPKYPFLTICMCKPHHRHAVMFLLTRRRWGALPVLLKFV
jgi:hypothetical protein